MILNPGTGSETSDPLQDYFRAWLGVLVFLMDDPLGPEFLGLTGGVCYVVLMGEKNEALSRPFPGSF